MTVRLSRLQNRECSPLVTQPAETQRGDLALQGIRSRRGSSRAWTPIGKTERDLRRTKYRKGDGRISLKVEEQSAKVEEQSAKVEEQSATSLRPRYRYSWPRSRTRWARLRTRTSWFPRLPGRFRGARHHHDLLQVSDCLRVILHGRVGQGAVEECPGTDGGACSLGVHQRIINGDRLSRAFRVGMFHTLLQANVVTART